MTTSFLSFDLETTSKQPQQARIVQAALVEFELFLLSDLGCSVAARSCPDHLRRYALSSEWRECSRYVTLVDPGVAIPSQATQIHGIDDAAVAAAPTTKQVLPELLRRLRGSILIGYNIVDYDLPTLQAECRRHYLADDFRDMMKSLRGVVDVMPWAARTSTAPQYRRGARTLETMSRRHGVALAAAHDAGEDAAATGKLMLQLQAQGDMPCLDDCVEATITTWQHLCR